MTRPATPSARVGPASGPCVMAGSHIDTVPDGGPLDGALGVLSALEVARVLAESGSALPRAFECVAFVEEEGRYSDCMGSKAMTGQIEAGEVAAARDPDGNSLADAMCAAGFDAGEIGAARRPGRGRGRLSRAAYRAGPGAGEQRPSHRGPCRPLSVSTIPT